MNITSEKYNKKLNKLKKLVEEYIDKAKIYSNDNKNIESINISINFVKNNLKYINSFNSDDSYIFMDKFIKYLNDYLDYFKMLENKRDNIESIINGIRNNDIELQYNLVTKDMNSIVKLREKIEKKNINNSIKSSKKEDDDDDDDFFNMALWLL